MSLRDDIASILDERNPPKFEAMDQVEVLNALQQQLHGLRTAVLRMAEELDKRGED